MRDHCAYLAFVLIFVSFVGFLVSLLLEYSLDFLVALGCSLVCSWVYRVGRGVEHRSFLVSLGRFVVYIRVHSFSTPLGNMGRIGGFFKMCLLAIL